jgi:hypothetical protein
VLLYFSWYGRSSVNLQLGSNVSSDSNPLSAGEATAEGTWQMGKPWVGCSHGRRDGVPHSSGLEACRASARC